MTVLAHAGHWATSLIYAAPVVLLVVLLVVDRFRHGPDHARRDDRTSSTPTDPKP